MKSKQAKVSVETMKEVQNDKTLRTKGDKDRRLREKKQNNTKRFVDERKNAQMKQLKEKEKLKARHDKETEALSKDIQSVSIVFTLVLHDILEIPPKKILIISFFCSLSRCTKMKKSSSN